MNVSTSVANSRITVRISYPNYRSNPVIPILTLPLIGQVPNVPQDISAEATLSP